MTKKIDPNYSKNKQIFSLGKNDNSVFFRITLKQRPTFPLIFTSNQITLTTQDAFFYLKLVKWLENKSYFIKFLMNSGKR